MTLLKTEKGFIQVIEDYQGLIHKISRSYCSDAEDRKDLVQEIILQLWRSHDRYDKQYAISTWIYRVALNVSISFLRKSKARRTHDHVSLKDEIHVDEDDLSSEVAELYRVINQLDELSRALMILYLDEKSYKEIAEILGITETNVASKINRLKKKLKKQYNR